MKSNCKSYIQTVSPLNVLLHDVDDPGVIFTVYCGWPQSRHTFGSPVQILVQLQSTLINEFAITAVTCKLAVFVQVYVIPEVTGSS